jgi:hypothetical protein
MHVSSETLTRRLPTAGCFRMLMRDSFSRSLYQAFRLSSLMPTQKTRSRRLPARANFAIQFQGADLLEKSFLDRDTPCSRAPCSRALTPDRCVITVSARPLAHLSSTIASRCEILGEAHGRSASNSRSTR